jgi:hypothetical protein
VIELTTTTAIAIASLTGFLSLLATLVFLWKVYKRGGRQDLTAAGRALRDARTYRLPNSGTPLTRPRTRTQARAVAAPADPVRPPDQSE